MSLLDEVAIERVALGVMDRTLPRSEWNHAGHFAAALWLYRYRRDLTRAEEIRALISRYNEATMTANTDTGGYHHTITLASMGAAADHLASHPPDVPLHVVFSALMASRYGDPDWLLAYWTRELLFSVPARRGGSIPILLRCPFRCPHPGHQSGRRHPSRLERGAGNQFDRSGWRPQAGFAFP